MNQHPKKAPLAITAWDLKLGRLSPDPRLTAEPEKSLGQILTEDQLIEYLFKSVARISTLLKKAQGGNLEFKQLLAENRDYYLIPDIEYLKQIGRLPIQFADLDPAAKFRL